MKLWPIFLFAAAGVGFAIVAKKTGKPSGTATVGGTDYRTSIYSGYGGFYARVFVDGKPSGATIGPLPTEADAEAQAVAYLAGLNAVWFYTVHAVEATPGAYNWFFDGWSRGTKIVSDEGPFASETAAMTAGANWARQEIV